jgi:UDP-N-acetylglucosamine 2-epimerase (non-hydrolysing)
VIAPESQVVVGIVYGTTGELIKLAPVIFAIEARGSRPQLWCTGQQVQQIPAFQRDLGIREVDVWLARGSGGVDLSAKRQIPRWASRVAASVLTGRSALRDGLASHGTPFLLVHGDTMTTVLGALAANLSREKARGEIVDTAQNTIRDALDLALAARVPTLLDLPDEPFGLISIHRFELIEREHLLQPLLTMLHEHSRHQPLLFVDHSTTRAVINRNARLMRLFDERFRRIPRQPYLQFVALMRRAAFLVSDSGGSQEESAILGLPCLIHRALSERESGLGSTVLLSGLDLNVVRGFLEEPGRWRREVIEPNLGPSKIIVDDLARRGAL